MGPFEARWREMQRTQFLVRMLLSSIRNARQEQQLNIKLKEELCKRDLPVELILNTKEEKESFETL
jgi:hypothetical protein